MTTFTPRELTAEVGYRSESRPGRTVREYLRKRYPEHAGLWELDDAQADDVRANVPRAS